MANVSIATRSRSSSTSRTLAIEYTPSRAVPSRSVRQSRPRAAPPPSARRAPPAPVRARHRPRARRCTPSRGPRDPRLLRGRPAVRRPVAGDAGRVTAGRDGAGRYTRSEARRAPVRPLDAGGGPDGATDGAPMTGWHLAQLAHLAQPSDRRPERRPALHPGLGGGHRPPLAPDQQPPDLPAWRPWAWPSTPRPAAGGAWPRAGWGCCWDSACSWCPSPGRHGRRGRQAAGGDRRPAGAPVRPA